MEELKFKSGEILNNKKKIKKYGWKFYKQFKKEY